MLVYILYLRQKQLRVVRTHQLLPSMPCLQLQQWRNFKLWTSLQKIVPYALSPSAPGDIFCKFVFVVVIAFLSFVYLGGISFINIALFYLMHIFYEL